MVKRLAVQDKTKQNFVNNQIVCQYRHNLQYSHQGFRAKSDYKKDKPSLVKILDLLIGNIFNGDVHLLPK